MHDLRLDPSLFRCSFLPINGVSDLDLISPWLLGQTRCIDAWRLFVRCPRQHLFLSDFTGFDAAELLIALDQQEPLVEQPGFLIPSDDDKSVWQKQTAESVDAKAVKNAISLERIRVLDGMLSRGNLLGRLNKDKGFVPGLVSSCEILVLPATRLLVNPELWLVLRDVLKVGHVCLGNGEVMAPVTCKLVITGESIEYDALNDIDPQFTGQVPLLAESQSEWFVDADTGAVLWCSCADAIAQQYAKRPLSPDALRLLTYWASRMCEHQKRLSLAWHELGTLMAQCDGEPDSPITKPQLRAALKSQDLRHNSVALYARRDIEEALVRVDTQGEKIGQINGLTVIDYCGYSYGEPARITVSVHYGDGEVADIERKSELGGNIHAKGMMILSALLYQIFGQDEPLHLSANIVFEQSYSTIDGDSASLAEYCCLIATIADVPIKQGLALTGAIDQFGNVQAIGGINEKIEGFFHLCRYRGFTGEQGVIIPKANISQLNLHIDVIEAARQGSFHLYHVDHVDEALSLVTGMDVGVADKENRFPKESLYGLVNKRLQRFAGDEDDSDGSALKKWMRKWINR